MNKQIFPFLLLVLTIACNNQPANPNASKDSTGEALQFTQLKKLIHQYPDSAKLYDLLINEYAAQKNYKMATAWADAAILHDSVKNFQYWFVKGDLFRQNLQYDSAIRNYEAYLKKFPDDEDILLNLANTFAEASNAKCLPLTDRLMKGFPTNETKTRCLFIRGVYFARSKQWQLANESFDKAIQIDYQFAEAYIEKGIALYDQQKIGAAQAVFGQLKEVNNTYPDAYYWIAKCQEADNHKDSALSNYQKAFGLDKTYTDAKDAVERLKKNG